MNLPLYKWQNLKKKKIWFLLKRGSQKSEKQAFIWSRYINFSQRPHTFNGSQFWVLKWPFCKSHDLQLAIYKRSLKTLTLSSLEIKLQQPIELLIRFWNLILLLWIYSDDIQRLVSCVENANSDWVGTDWDYRRRLKSKCSRSTNPRWYSKNPIHLILKPPSSQPQTYQQWMHTLKTDPPCL